MGRLTRTKRFDFRGHNAFPATASGVGSELVTAVTGAGPPAISSPAGGGIRLGLEATAEVQNLCLYMGDALPFDIDQLIRATFIARAGQTFDATTQIAFGLASARADAIDNLTEQSLFRCIGNNTLVVETDDGATDRNDIATGMTMSTSFGVFEILFAQANQTKEPPTLSTGRPSNVQFYCPNVRGNKRRVASGTLFDMSNYAGGLQFFAQIQKTSDTNADYFEILEAEFEFNLPDFS